MPDRSELDFLAHVARRAGALVRSVFRGEYHLAHKIGDDPVTTADLAADTLLREEITAAFPEDGWLSEETTDSPERLARRRVWIVDPLDGTREFVKGIPEFAVSVAQVEEGKPRLAVVYNPIRDELFAAARGCGTELNGVQVRITGRTVLDGAKALVSRSETAAGLLGSLARRTDLESIGSVAYKLALVAAGRGDLTLSVRPKSEWDVCAGALLAEEAGAVVTDLVGGGLVFNRRFPKLRGILAAGPELHAAAGEFLRSAPELIAALDAPRNR